MTRHDRAAKTGRMKKVSCSCGNNEATRHDQVSQPRPHLMCQDSSAAASHGHRMERRGCLDAGRDVRREGATRWSGSPLLLSRPANADCAFLRCFPAVLPCCASLLCLPPHGHFLSIHDTCQLFACMKLHMPHTPFGPFSLRRRLFTSAFVSSTTRFHTCRSTQQYGSTLGPRV